MKYFIDFDGTICPGDVNDAPHTACRAVLKELKRRNHTITIFSCRSNPDCVEDAGLATREIVEYMVRNDLPYDDIYHGKPFFNYLIDDRSVGVPLDSKYNVDWEQIQKKIEW